MLSAPLHAIVKRDELFKAHSIAWYTAAGDRGMGGGAVACCVGVAEVAFDSLTKSKINESLICGATAGRYDKNVNTLMRCYSWRQWVFMSIKLTVCSMRADEYATRPRHAQVISFGKVSIAHSVFNFCRPQDPAHRRKK